MLNPVTTWASSFENIMKDVFANAALPGFDPVSAIAEAWQKWVYDNSSAIGCIAPILPPVPLSGTATASSFAPLIFPSPGTPATAASILSTAFGAYAGSISWIPPPPAPPFSVITGVVTNAASVVSSQATLHAALIAEFAIIPPPGGEQLKYTALATLFWTAMSTIIVDFIGLGIGAPPPALLIPVPIF